MSSKEKGIQQVQATPHGYVIITAKGSTLLQPGTDAFDSMKAIETMALAQTAQANQLRISTENDTLIESALKKPVEAKPASLFKRLKTLAQGLKSAPTAITIVKGPPEPRVPPVLSPTHAAPAAQHRGALAAALANRAAATVSAPTPPSPPPANPPGALLLHHWELKRGRDGNLYASGIVHGLPHFPDGCTVETPTLGVYHKQSNSFEVAHSRQKITFGMVKPGEETKQSALMQAAHQQVAVIDPKPALPENLAVEGVHVKNGRAHIRLTDKSVVASHLNHPIGLAVRNLAHDLTVSKFPVEWGFPAHLTDLEVAKQAATAAQASQPNQKPAPAAGPVTPPPNPTAANPPPPAVKQPSTPPRGQPQPAPEEFIDQNAELEVHPDASFEISTPVGAKPDTAPAIGTIDKLYAPTDGSGVDAYKIIVKTPLGVAANAEITKQQYETMKPLVDAGMTGAVNACMQLDTQSGKWTFDYLVDPTGEALTNAQIDLLWMEARKKLEAKAPAKAPSPTSIPGVSGDVRIPGFSHLAPQPPAPKPPEPGI